MAFRKTGDVQNMGTVSVPKDASRSTEQSHPAPREQVSLSAEEYEALKRAAEQNQHSK